jgi:hypothetical protein
LSLPQSEVPTCTITNARHGTATLRKTTNGIVDAGKDITFLLRGHGLPASGIARTTLGDADGVLEFGDALLTPGQTYTICEHPVPAGFTSFWKLDAMVVTPYNPDASLSPPEDLGNRCYDFQVSPGQRRSFEVDNSHPGGDPRTIGYWKNWNRCTTGNQSRTGREERGRGGRLLPRRGPPAPARGGLLGDELPAGGEAPLEAESGWSEQGE